MKYQGKALELKCKQDTEVHETRLQGGTYKVSDIINKETTVKAKAPYITSTLQQAASTRLGYGVKRTMTAAQKLYERGYITYMRTDSTYLSNEAIQALRSHIQLQYGDAYLPATANVYGNKANAQEAHETIRPTDVQLTPLQLQDVGNDEIKLYELIRNNTIASQMTPAKYDTTTIHVVNGGYEGTAKGKTVIFDGWTRVMSVQKSDDEQDLPVVQVDETLPLHQLHVLQCFTKPPARYNEASLVKTLEKQGIGRPSTYASIITTIQDRGYVRIENKKFYAENIGMIVTDRLMSSFTDMMEYQYTAQLEQTLDDIALHKQDWRQVLDVFFAKLSSSVKQAALPVEQGGMLGNKITHTGISCSKCGKEMLLRDGSNGPFLGL